MSKPPPASTKLWFRPRLETPKERAQRDRRVAKIRGIIANVATKQQVEQAIIFHDAHFLGEERPGRHWIQNKRQKAAVSQLRRALWLLKAALNQKDLIFTLRSDLPISDSDLEKYYRLVGQIAATRLPNRRNLNYAKRYAVASAADLCRRHGVELAKSRRGKFCRVAQLFYRHGNVNLYHSCCNYLTQNQV